MYYATSYFVLIKRINLIQLFFKLLGGQVILKQKQKGSIKELTQTAILYSKYCHIYLFKNTIDFLSSSDDYFFKVIYNK